MSPTDHNQTIFAVIRSRDQLLFSRLNLTFAVAFLVALLGCSSPGVEELARVRSPDGMVDAIWIQENYGATVAYVDKVYIVPANTKVTDQSHVLLAEVTGKMSMVWDHDKVLRLNFSKARIFEFSNFWSGEGSEYREVRLDPQEYLYK